MSVAFDDHGEMVPSLGTTSETVVVQIFVLRPGAVGQQLLQHLPLALRERTRELDEVPVLGADACELGECFASLLEELVETETRRGRERPGA